MENIEITKEVKFLESIGKWCVGLYCPQYSIWTGGFFDKKLERAETEAMASLKKSIAYKRECEKKAEVSKLIIAY